MSNSKNVAWSTEMTESLSATLLHQGQAHHAFLVKVYAPWFYLIFPHSNY